MVGGLIVVGHDINSNILSSIYQNIDLWEFSTCLMDRERNSLTEIKIETTLPYI